VTSRRQKTQNVVLIQLLRQSPSCSNLIHRAGSQTESEVDNVNSGKSEISELLKLVRLLESHATGKAGFLCLCDGLPLKGQDFLVCVLETCTRHVEVFAYVDISGMLLVIWRLLCPSMHVDRC
jgi:hypothetical protein